MSVDDLLKPKMRPRPGLIDMLDAAADAKREGGSDPGLEPVEKLTPLPEPGDPYAAHARAANKPVLTLRLVLGNATIRGFSYANLDSLDWLPGEKPGEGPRLLLRFDGLKPTEVVLEGRHLDKLYDLCGDHRIRWVRELPTGRDYRDADEVAITRITAHAIDDKNR